MKNWYLYLDFSESDTQPKLLAMVEAYSILEADAIVANHNGNKVDWRKKFVATRIVFQIEGVFKSMTSLIR